MANPIPEGYGTVTPYLHVRGASEAIEFYSKAFGATEIMRMPVGDKIAHAELQIGNSRIMLADENPEWGVQGPQTLGGTTAGYCLYVEDCDAMYAQAIAAGATVERPLMDQFYGDRSGSVVDPFGHKWTISTHKEDVPDEEMPARMEAWMKTQQ